MESLVDLSKQLIITDQVWAVTQGMVEEVDQLEHQDLLTTLDNHQIILLMLKEQVSIIQSIH